jgi:lipoprotein NlpD
MPPPESRLSAAPVRTAVLRRFAAGALLLCVVACSTRVPAPVEERSPRAVSPGAAAAIAPSPAAEPEGRPQTYTVKRGDTLYAIALDHGLEYRELAAWNNIENINLIRVGQVLRIAAPGETAPTGTAGVTTMPLQSVPPVVAGEATSAPSARAPQAVDSGARNAENYKIQPKAVKEPYSEQALRDMQRVAGATPAPAPAPAPAPTAPPPEAVLPVVPPVVAPAVVSRADPRTAAGADDENDKVDWVWPAKGRIVTGFSEAASLKGIDIAGTAGQPVTASADGKIVYAGTGLRGYGKLIIIKHSSTYLSAYAHNRDILVKEGQQVAKGQKIAEMGNSDADQVKLHFEIRRHGKPVDPLRYLPPA